MMTLGSFSNSSYVAFTRSADCTRVVIRMEIYLPPAFSWKKIGQRPMLETVYSGVLDTQSICCISSAPVGKDRLDGSMLSTNVVTWSTIGSSVTEGSESSQRCSPLGEPLRAVVSSESRFEMTCEVR